MLKYETMITGNRIAILMSLIEIDRNLEEDLFSGIDFFGRTLDFCEVFQSFSVWENAATGT